MKEEEKVLFDSLFNNCEEIEKLKDSISYHQRNLEECQIKLDQQIKTNRLLVTLKNKQHNNN